VPCSLSVLLSSPPRLPSSSLLQLSQLSRRGVLVVYEDSEVGQAPWPVAREIHVQHARIIAIKTHKKIYSRSWAFLWGNGRWERRRDEEEEEEG